MEIWKDIKGFKGLYQVSNLGKVKSLGNGNSNNSKEKILKPVKRKDGYLMVGLYKDGKVKGHQVHRLVASAFLPNDNLFKTEVNHKDEDKTNNRADNLEWCDRQYNVDYSLAKSVNQYNLNGEYIRTWKSTCEIERELGYDNGNISKCCLGKSKSAYKYKWQYA